jgi:uncharacterized protein (DUF433 family)
VRFEDVPIIQAAEAIGAKKRRIAVVAALALYGQGFSEDGIASKTGLDIGEVKEVTQFARDSQEKIAEAQDLLKQGFSEEEIAANAGLDIGKVKEQAQIAKEIGDNAKAKVLRAKDLIG